MPLLNIEKFSIRPATGILCAIAPILAGPSVKARGRAARIAILCRGGGVVLDAGTLAFSEAQAGARLERLKTLLKYDGDGRWNTNNLL
jgi:hypothetical protein